jgi:hypothetical protein
MAEYIELPLLADATALGDIGKEQMSSDIPGWEARPGNVETVLLESNGQIAAELVDQVAQVPPVIFAYYGDWLLGITLREAIPAVGIATFAFPSGAVVTVPEGTLFAAPNPDGESYVFQTDTEVRSDAIDKTTGATALEAGANANGCSGTCELIDSIVGVDSITIAGTTGGADAETGDEYLDRLADALTILAPRPILPQDFATMARLVPGVGRAVAIDLYQPSIAEGGVGEPRDAASHSPIARCCTVAITKDDGTMPEQGLMQLVWETIDGAREVNFLAYVIPPTYAVIDVQATVVTYPGYLPAEVAEAAQEMMRQWLNPSTWGSEEIGEQTGWARVTSARIYEAVDYLNRATGVNYVESVQLRLSGGAWSSADIPLTGTAPLPSAGDLSGIVANSPSP